MISFEEAKVIAESQIPSHHSFVEIIEKPYGWYFYSQSKAHIESGDFRHMEVGSAGLLLKELKAELFLSVLHIRAKKISKFTKPDLLINLTI
jgi:hypothetical protein